MFASAFIRIGRLEEAIVGSQREIALNFQRRSLLFERVGY
jgi:hypothetical protein